MSDFLTRWSRRKRAANVQMPAAQPPAVDPVTPRSGDGQPAETMAGERTPLPDISEIAADTDIKGFLAPDVAPELRKAALRRAWAADPAVRDFVGPARDYGYDWNSPGGVPGFGPLAPAAAARAVVTVGEMLSRMERTQVEELRHASPDVGGHPTTEESTT
jgi:hypothetical protein